MIKANVHSIESFGSVDGPGIRFIIFLQGCPMRCLFCHNPDTWELGKGQEFSADELLDKAERYKSYWGDEGGITVSGGEALLQIDFLIEFFSKAKLRGINTCLDTSAQPFTRREPYFSKFETLMKYTDTILLDIKHINDAEHRKLTHHSNSNILDCAKYLSDTGKKVWIRHVLIPGITDKEEYLSQLNAFIKTLKNVERVEILPYHRLGVHKYEAMGWDYQLKEVKENTPEKLEIARKLFEQYFPVVFVN